MKTLSFWKKSVYSALIFFGTLVVLTVGYAAWNATMGKVTTGSPLTATAWNAFVDNIEDLNSRWSRVGSDIAFTGGNVGIGTANPGVKLEIAGETKSTNGTFTDATAQSITTGAIKLNAIGGAIIFDDAGQKRISWNDGGGNFNIRSGNYFQAGAGISFTKGSSDSNGGASSITMNSDGTDGTIALNVATIGTPGNPVTWNNNLIITPTLSYFSTGNVGIGVTNPQAKLEVNGTIKFQHMPHPPYVCSGGTHWGEVYLQEGVNQLCYCNSANWVQIKDGTTVCQ